MRIYPTIFNIVFSKMDAEQAHHVGFTAIKIFRKLGLSKATRPFFAPDASLQTRVMGLDFPSPFGLAAGFDKGATGINALSDIGFGHIEIGTVTGQAQPGNPKPRLFRLIPDKAIVNRMGFNNEGCAKIGPRLAAARADLEAEYRGKTRPIIGVNIGKTKAVAFEDAIEDYRLSTRTLAPQADYLVVNVSSPNTPGLRDLQAVETLRPLLVAVREEADRAVTGRQVPLTVKIAPDLADEDVLAVAELALELKLDGIITTNTTIAREGLGLISDKSQIEKCGAGGLSGKPLAPRALEVLKLVKKTVGEQMAVIAVGGVTSAADVQERLDAGADLVQGYTAFLYEGPFWARAINRGLKK